MLKDRETFIRILVLAAVSAAVLLSASSSTLLIQGYGIDYTIFKVMGEGWAAGKIPFRDLFDHKGPVIFLIQMMASFISKSKVVIWVWELVWIVATCEMLYRCGRYIGTPKKLNYLSMMIAMIIYACYIDGGNTIEVWSLPFEVLPLLLLLRALSGRTKLRTVALAGGLCFGIVAMTRINNNAMITGLVIGMAIYLCRRREYGRLMCCAGWFLSSLAISVMPFVIYFWSVDAFEDFIYSSFIYNMSYMKNVPPSASILYKTMELLPCVILLPILALYSRKEGIDLPLILAPVPVAVYLTFCFGIGYLHYFLMALPLAALSIQLLWPLGRYVKVAVLALYFISSGYVLRWALPYKIRHLGWDREREAVFPGVMGRQFVSEFIPDSEKESVYVYGDAAPAGALNANGYWPVGKYFFLQYIMQGVDPKAHDDIIEKFREADPKWVISDTKDMAPLNESMAGYVEIPRDSLPPSCPETWHVYYRK